MMRFTLFELHSMLGRKNINALMNYTPPPLQTREEANLGGTKLSQKGAPNDAFVCIFPQKEDTTGQTGSTLKIHLDDHASEDSCSRNAPKILRTCKFIGGVISGLFLGSGDGQRRPRVTAEPSNDHPAVRERPLRRLRHSRAVCLRGGIHEGCVWMSVCVGQGLVCVCECGWDRRSLIFSAIIHIEDSCLCFCEKKIIL